MTHTLHRTHHIPGGPADYIVFSMAAQGFNNKGAAEKLKATLRILLKHQPVNAGDDNIGGVFTGQTIEGIMAHASEKSYMASVYDSKEKAEAALKELKEADLGLSVVVTGNRGAVFELLKNVGLRPHTVNLSLGCFGKTDKLPPPEILDITTMCGHGMVCPDHVSHVIRRVRAGKMTPEEAALDLARPCTCAMFNPKRAEHLIASICCAGKGEAEKP
ncbi:MAG: hypothetical protein AB1700_17230 [Bacillota bacterium]